MVSSAGLSTKKDFRTTKNCNLSDFRLSLVGHLLRLAGRDNWGTDPAGGGGWMGKMTPVPPQGKSFPGWHSYDNNVKCGRVLHFN